MAQPQKRITRELDLDYEDIKSGFQTGKAAAIADWQFKKEVRGFAVIVNRLRVKKWAKENPDKRRVIANRYAAKPDAIQRGLDLAKKRRHDRHRAEGKVFVCQLEHYRAEFCRVPGTKGPGMHPRFCSPSHYTIWYAREKQKNSPNRRPCGVCGELGHNRRGCANPPDTKPEGKGDRG